MLLNNVVANTANVTSEIIKEFHDVTEQVWTMSTKKVSINI